MPDQEATIFIPTQSAPSMRRPASLLRGSKPLGLDALMLRMLRASVASTPQLFADRDPDSWLKCGVEPDAQGEQLSGIGKALVACAKVLELLLLVVTVDPFNRRTLG